jgi:hypothetical protein
MRNVREYCVENYRKIIAEGLLSKRREQYFEALWDFGKPATGGQLGELTPDVGVSQNRNITTRLRELQKMGVVVELGYVTCPVTKVKAMLWDVTGGLPQKLERSKPKVKNSDLVDSLKDMVFLFQFYFGPEVSGKHKLILSKAERLLNKEFGNGKATVSSNVPNVRRVRGRDCEQEHPDGSVRLF